MNQKYFKTPLSPFRFSTKIIEFDYANFSKVCHLKVLFEETFLRFKVTLCFKKKKCFKNLNFLTHFSQQVLITRLLENKFTFHPQF